MKLTIENTVYKEKKKVIIEVDRDDYDIHELWDEVVKPALIAYGYGENTVDRITRP